MIQFDFCIFLRWVGSTTNQVTTSNLPTECYCAQLGAVTSAHIFLVKWEVWNRNDVSTAGKSNLGWFLMDLMLSNWIFGENLWICRFGQETISPLFFFRNFGDTCCFYLWRNALENTFFIFLPSFWPGQHFAGWTNWNHRYMQRLPANRGLRSVHDDWRCHFFFCILGAARTVGEQKHMFFIVVFVVP